MLVKYYNSNMQKYQDCKCFKCYLTTISDVKSYEFRKIRCDTRVSRDIFDIQLTIK